MAGRQEDKPFAVRIRIQGSSRESKSCSRFIVQYCKKSHNKRRDPIPQEKKYIKSLSVEHP